jgi:hypothetical protein
VHEQARRIKGPKGPVMARYLHHQFLYDLSPHSQRQLVQAPSGAPLHK